MFMEARYLLAEEPDLRDPALYHSVLAAIAEGNTMRGAIANHVGRKTNDLGHPLNVLGPIGSGDVNGRGSPRTYWDPISKSCAENGYFGSPVTGSAAGPFR